MNKLLLILLLIISSTTLSFSQDISFSDYDPALKYASTNKFGAHVFEGEITVTGSLFFTFDMATPEQAGGILFARFVPDNTSRNRLPNVISGAFASPINYISLEPANIALESIFGKDEAERLKKGKGSDMKVSATVVLYNFLTDIECDSRTYWSLSFSVKPIQNGTISTDVKSPSGC